MNFGLSCVKKLAYDLRINVVEVKNMGGLSDMMDILRKPRVFNLMVQILLLFTIGQQIYFPQTYKYMHLVMLVVRLVISETYQNEHRVYKWDVVFLPMILLSSIISIIEKTANINLGLMYLILLMGIMFLMSLMVGEVIKDTKGHLKEKMHPKHIQAYEKNSIFTLGLFYTLYALTILGLSFTFYEIILLFFGS